MTSGMSGKGSALGASDSESGAPPKRAPAPRPPEDRGHGASRGRGSGNGSSPADRVAPAGPVDTDPQEAGIGGTEGAFPDGIGAESVSTALSSSVRTLILGIDYDGRIVQHDRPAPRILAREPDELLGVQLSDLTARPADGAAAIGGLLEAIRADREGTAMLTVHTRDGRSAEAVVTVHPMRAGDTGLAALAVVRIPVPQAERFVDPAVMRRQMLDDTFTRISDTLDIEQVASELLGALVPHFCNAADLLLLESLAGDDKLPADGPEGSVPLRRIALRHERQDPA